MENLTVLNVFNLLPSNPQNAEVFKNEIEKQLYDEGNLYPHEVMSVINATVKILSEIVKTPRFKNVLYHSMSDTKEIYDGFTITQKYVNKYIFDNCNDYVYSELTRSIKELEEQKKEREKFLRAIPEDGIVNPETGELISRAQTESSLSFVVNFKKPKQKETNNNHLDSIFNK